MVAADNRTSESSIRSRHCAAPPFDSPPCTTATSQARVAPNDFSTSPSRSLSARVHFPAPWIPAVRAPGFGHSPPSARIPGPCPASARSLRAPRYARRWPLRAPFAERVPVVGDELGTVAGAADLYVERLLRGEMGLVRLHRRDHGINGVALEGVDSGGPGTVNMAELRIALAHVEALSVLEAARHHVVLHRRHIRRPPQLHARRGGQSRPASSLPRHPAIGATSKLWRVLIQAM